MGHIFIKRFIKPSVNNTHRQLLQFVCRVHRNNMTVRCEFRWKGRFRNDDRTKGIVSFRSAADSRLTSAVGTRHTCVTAVTGFGSSTVTNL